MAKRVRILVKGRVQGVFFRRNTEKVAKKLGLTGWVKNSGEGVEIVAEGDKVDELVAWCQKGPLIAKVDSVSVKEEKTTGKFTNFEIRY